MQKLVKILKKIKIKNILILIIMIMFNTYAWFIYSTRVNTSIDVHISSWNVEFSVGEDKSETNILISVDRAFPGMDNYEKVITVRNKGEIKARLTSEIKSLTVLGEKFVVGENITQEELLNKIQTEYPFKILINENVADLEAGTGNGTFTVSVVWPFESGDDIKDTEWGNKAYEYYALNPNKKCIEIDLRLIAEQIATN